MQAQFDNTVILRRSPIWSRAILWSLVGVTTFGVLWANLAQIDEAVPAVGKLEPQGSVRDIQVPLNGVVKQVHVKDGQRIKANDLLLTLDQSAATAQRNSLVTIRAALEAENQFYRQELAGTGSTSLPAGFKPSAETLALTKSRRTLLAEAEFYRAQLAGDGSGLSPDQQTRLDSSLTERTSREQATRLEAAQLERQLAQAEVQLANAQETLQVNQGIFDGLSEVARQGGVARVQYLRQQQEVANSQARVNQLIQERERLTLAIAQARQRLDNTVATSQQDVLTRLADNEKRLAEIDSQLNKAIVENDKRIAEINSQLSQANVTLGYQEVRAPVAGVVFDLKASGSGFVANSTEPVLKIVPEDSLRVEVFIPNKDIGFIKPGMLVDVRIDAFPFSEFGDIKGELESIGSDALPPTQERPYYSFPAKIKLDRQSLLIQGREAPLQSGMSVSVNIKTRKRSIMSIFTDAFNQKIDTLKTVR